MSLNPFRAFKRWRRRREIVRRLVAYAKTKDGRKFIEEMNEGNLILADLDAAELGAETYVGSTLRIRLPDEQYRALCSVRAQANKSIPKDHFVHIGSAWMDK